MVWSLSRKCPSSPPVKLLSVLHYLAPRPPPPWSLHMARHNWCLLPLGSCSTTPTSVFTCLYCSETVTLSPTKGYQNSDASDNFGGHFMFFDQHFSSSTCILSFYFFTGSSLLPPGSPTQPLWHMHQPGSAKELTSGATLDQQGWEPRDKSLEQ